MDSCRSRRQILILDCCHSGAFARGTKGEQKAITETTFEGSGFGRVVLTASDSTQYALEGDQVVYNARINRDATNMEQALSLAAALIPEDVRGRIVLISDGNETSGNLRTALDELLAREIAVDVLPQDYSFEHEVWVERLDLPQFVKVGETYEASVVLSSITPGKAKLQLEENGEVIGEIDIEYQAGKNRYDVPIYLREPGYYEYKVTVKPEPGHDSIAANNEAVNYIYVEGEGKALLVTDPLGDERDWQALRRAILDGERAVETIDAYDFPRDALSLMPYDCVLFANVPYDAFDTVQLQALHDAVYNQGLGFLMIGGQNSFGPGGYHRSVVENVLPVTMDITKKKILPKGALAIILHTCEFPEGNTWAKRITKQAIKVLGAQDEVAVIDYSIGGANWVFKMTPASEYEKLVPLINSSNPGDMPAFAPTMSMGLNALKASDAATKHMIIISDGDPQPPPPALLNAIANLPVGGAETKEYYVWIGDHGNRHAAASFHQRRPQGPARASARASPRVRRGPHQSARRAQPRRADVREEGPPLPRLDLHRDAGPPQLLLDDGGDPAAKLMFAYKVSRSRVAEPNCLQLTVPEGCTRLKLDSSTILGIGIRTYLEPATGVGPAMSEILYNRVIKFSPRQ